MSWGWLSCWLGWLACSPPPPQDDTVLESPRGDCNPVDSSHCLLPFPSDFFLSPTDDTPSGVQVDFGPTSLPTNIDGVGIDPVYWNERDGFSTLNTLYAHLPDATLAGVVGHANLADYSAADARTVVLDAETGERVPHFVEREAAAEGTDRALLMLRPVRPMRHDQRYIVGIRGLVDARSELVSAPEGFAALRDGDASSDPDLERQRDHYEAEVFPVLEDAGFARSELQLAWSFRTVSEAGSLEKILWMREDLYTRLGDDGPDYTITSTTDSDCGKDTRIWRTVEGTLSVPLYLTDWEPGSLLTRDSTHMPVYNGQVDVPFLARVPCSLYAAPQPSRLVQYGHGLFADRYESTSESMDRLADDAGWIFFATDWTGLKNSDSGSIALMMVSEPYRFATIPERTMQGYVEAMAAARAMRGALGQDAAFSSGGESLIDPDQIAFYGNSQGAVLGGGYAALARDVDRVVLGVGGMPFTLLLTRAVGFEPFITLLETMYEDWADISLLLGAMQILWDPAESTGYAGHLSSDPLDALTPAKDVLLQVAIGDASVPTLGAHVMARAYGASLIDPPTREVWGLETATPDFAGSGLVEFDYGIEEPVEAVPATSIEDNPHDYPRASEPGQEQIRVFLGSGLITHTCEGVCDPD